MVAGDVQQISPARPPPIGAAVSQQGSKAEQEPDSHGDLWVPTHNVRLSPHSEERSCSMDASRSRTAVAVQETLKRIS